MHSSLSFYVKQKLTLLAWNKA